MWLSHALHRVVVFPGKAARIRAMRAGSTQAPLPGRSGHGALWVTQPGSHPCVWLSHATHLRVQVPQRVGHVVHNVHPSSPVDDNGAVVQQPGQAPELLVLRGKELQHQTDQALPVLFSRATRPSV